YWLRHESNRESASLAPSWKILRPQNHTGDCNELPRAAAILTAGDTVQSLVDGCCGWVLLPLVSFSPCPTGLSASSSSVLCYSQQLLRHRVAVRRLRPSGTETLCLVNLHRPLPCGARFLDHALHDLLQDRRIQRHARIHNDVRLRDLAVR